MWKGSISPPLGRWMSIKDDAGTHHSSSLITFRQLCRLILGDGVSRSEEVVPESAL